MPEAGGHTSAVAPRRSRLRRRLRLPLLLLGPLLILAVAGYFYVTSGRYVATDDAYLRYNKVLISSDVAGRIVKQAVEENDVVKRGQLLFAIDDEPYRIALARAESQLAAARNEIEAMRGTYRQKLAQLKAAQASADYLQREHLRQQQLARQNVSSASKVEEAGRSAEVARQQAAAMEQEIAQALAALDGDPDMPLDRHARVLQAIAARDQAALDLRHTNIVAPADGVIANVDPRPGQFVAIGLPMCSLVEAGSLYVEANLKETELTHVRPGHEAVISVDTYPNRAWRARVLSISPGTGSEFSILPAQNATGNWVKIVQRVPVRLRIDPGEDLEGLRAGMSVYVEIDTHHETELPRFVAAALAMVGARR